MTLLERRMWQTRVLLVVVGMSLPYLARLPGTFTRGSQWLVSYVGPGIGFFMFLQTFNSLVWGMLYAASFKVRRPLVLLLPSLAGFGSLAYFHAQLDLAADAQMGVALVFIPVYSAGIAALALLTSIAVLGRGDRRSSEASESANRRR